ncbi:YadA-like family protein [uncultured Parasutterella sp.]|nr:YadA-like family protein [uncultured Parasutterella sp.]
MNSKKITGLAAGTAATDAVNLTQLKGATTTLATGESNLVLGTKVDGSYTVQTIALKSAVDLGASGSLTIGNSKIVSTGLTVGGTTVGNNSVKLGTGTSDLSLTNSSMAFGTTGTTIANNSIKLGQATGDLALTKAALTVGRSKLESAGLTVGNTTVKDNSIKLGTVATDLALTKAGLTVGNTTLTSGSLALTDGPTLSTGGLAMNSKKITGLAAGTAATDAVNLTQLKAATTTLATGESNLVLGTTVDGSYTVQTIALKSAVDLGTSGSLTIGNSKLESAGLTVGNTTVKDNSIKLGTAATDLALTKAALTVGNAIVANNSIKLGANTTDLALSSSSLKVGDTTLTSGSLALTNGPTLSTGGLAMNSKKITGLAAGTAATDAVNLTQLKAATTTLATGESNLVLGTTVDGSYTVQTIALKSAVDLGTSGSLTIGNSKLESAGLTVGNTTVKDNSIKLGTAATDLALTKAALTVGNAIVANNSIKLGANTTDLALSSSALTVGNTTLTSGSLALTNGPTLNTTGLDMASKKITGLANGEADTDAATMGQLRQVISSSGASYINGENITFEQDSEGFTTINGTRTSVASADENIRVALDETDQFNPEYSVTLNRDLNLDSITVGSNSLNSNGLYIGNDVSVDRSGLTISNGPVVSANGIDMNGKAITGLELSDAPNSAVTKEYVDSKIDGIAIGSVADSGTIYRSGQNVKISQTGTQEVEGKTYNIVEISAYKTTLSEVSEEQHGNLVITNAFGENDLTRTYDIKLSNNLDLTADGSLKIGVSSLNNTGLSVGGVKVLSTGIDAGGRVISNVGDATEDGDAVSLGKLNSILDAYTPSGDGEANYAIGDNLELVSEDGVETLHGYKTSVSAGSDSNIQVALDESSSHNPAYTVTLNRDLNLDRVTIGSNVLDSNGLQVGSNALNGSGLQIGSNGLDSSGLYIGNGVHVNSTGLTILNGPSVSNDGINMNNKTITGLVTLENDSTSAVTKGYLDNAISSIALGPVSDGERIYEAGLNVKISDKEVREVEGKTYRVVEISAYDTRLSEVPESDNGNLIITNTVDNDELTRSYDIKLSNNLNLTTEGSLKVGASTLSNTGLVVGAASVTGTGFSVGSVKVLSSGIDAGGKVISNVGNATQDGDAVSLGKLNTILAGYAPSNAGTGYAIGDNLELVTEDGGAQTLHGYKTTVSANNDGNITVALDDSTSHNPEYSIALNRNLNLDSITIGSSVFSSSGLQFGSTLLSSDGLNIRNSVYVDGTGFRIANGPAVSNSGINMNNKTITGLVMSNDGSSAVTKDYLDTRLSNIEIGTISDGKTIYEQGTGIVITDVEDRYIDGQAYKVVQISAHDTSLSEVPEDQNGNLIITNTITDDEFTRSYDIKLSNNLDLTADGSLKVGASTLNNTGLVVGAASVTGTGFSVGGVKVLSTGIDAGGLAISNVGEATQDGDAVSLGKLNSILAAYTPSENGEANYAIGDNLELVSEGGVETLHGYKTSVSAGNDSNIQVALDDSSSHNPAYTVTLNRDLNLDSVTIGSNVLNSSGLQVGSSVHVDSTGLRITGGPSFTVAGINMNNRKITGLIMDESDSSSAVTKEYVDGQISNIQIGAVSDGERIYQAGQNVIMKNQGTKIVGAKTYTVVEINAHDTLLSEIPEEQNGNLVITNTLGANELTRSYDIRLSNNLDLTPGGSLSIGAAALNNNGLVIGDTSIARTGLSIGSSSVTSTGVSVGSISISANGMDAAGKVISNIGEATQAGDAVSLGKLNSILATYTPSGDGEANYAIGDNLELVSEGGVETLHGYKTSVSAGGDSNIQVALDESSSHNPAYTVTLNRDLNLDSVTIGSNVLDSNGLQVGSNALNGSGLQIGSNGLDSSGLYIGNDVHVNSTGLTILNGPSVSNDGINMNNKTITGLLMTEAPTSAVTKEYVDTAISGIALGPIAAGDTIYEAGLNVTIADGGTKEVEGETYNVVKINAYDTRLSEVPESDHGNLIITNTVGSDELTRSYDIKLSNNLDLTADGSLKVGDSTLNTAGLVVGAASVTGTGFSVGSVKVLSSGIDAGGKVISNVGNATQDGDAVSLGKLNTILANYTPVGDGSNNYAIGDNLKLVTQDGTQTLHGYKTLVTNSNDANIQVSGPDDDSTTLAYSVTLNRDLDLDSVTTGSSVLNSSGLTVASNVHVDNTGFWITGGPKVSNSGINMNNRAITGLTTLESDPTSAVTKGYLDTKLSNIEIGGVSDGKRIYQAGSGVVISDAGKMVVDGQEYDVVEISAHDTLIAEVPEEQNGNLAITNSYGADESIRSYSIKLNNNLDLTADGSLKVGASTLNNTGLVVGTTTVSGTGFSVGRINISASGIDAGGNVISNLGEAKEAGDAVSLGKLTSMLAGYGPSGGGNGSAGYSIGKNLRLETSNGVQTLNGYKTTLRQAMDKNIVIYADDPDSLNPVYELRLNRELDLTGGSVTIGSTTINDNGISFGLDSGVSLSANGLNAGGKLITNLRDGVSPDDAVTVAQLRSLEANFAGGVITDANGFYLSGDNTEVVADGPNKRINTWYTEGRVSDDGSGNIIVDNDRDSATHTNHLTVSLNKDISLGATGSLTIGGSKLDNEGLYVGSVRVLSNYIDAGGNVISNVGEATQDGDAVSLGKLNSILENYSMNGGGNGGSVSNITGSEDFDESFVNSGVYASHNLGVVTDKKGNTTLYMSNNPTFNSVQLVAEGSDVAEGSEARTMLNLSFIKEVDDVPNGVSEGAEFYRPVYRVSPSDGIMTFAEPQTIKVATLNDLNKYVTNDTLKKLIADNNLSAPNGLPGDSSSGETSSGAVSVQSGDSNIKVVLQNGKAVISLSENIEIKETVTANKVVAESAEIGGTVVINKDGVSFKSGNGPKITENGIDANGTRITNLAPGEADTDAATVGQLKQAHSNVLSKINDVDKRAKAGIAQAIATAGLPQAYIPGRAMAAMAGGTFGGESAIAVGVSKISEDGHWVFKGTVSGNTQSKFGGSLGVGYQW